MTGGLPDPAVVVLVGAAGAGKSTRASARYRRHEVVSSDEPRAVVGSGEHDLDATTDAFALLDTIVAARTSRGLTTVVDTLGLNRARRRGYLAAARAAGLPALVVVFDTGPAEARRRNRARERPVPAKALAAQLRRMADVDREITDEGWDVVLRYAEPSAAKPPTSPATEPLLPPESPLRFVLQISASRGATTRPAG